MFVLRYCVCVSFGILMVLAGETSLTAQTVSSSDDVLETPKTRFDDSHLVNSGARSEPRVIEIKQMEESSKKSQQESEIVQDPVSPTPIEEGEPSKFQRSRENSQTILENLPPDNLNPNGNPLLFPTQPDEVETTIRQAITLDQAVGIALENNREIQEAREGIEELQADLGVQRADLFPAIDIETSVVRFRDDRVFGGGTDLLGNVLGEETTSAETFTDLRANATLSYDIYTGGDRSARIQRAEREVRSQQLQVEVITEQVRFETTDNYYLLQNADAQVAISQADVENASQTLRDAQLLEQAGLGTRFDVIRAEGDLATANETLTRAIAEQRTSRRRLGETLGVGQHVELSAADEIIESGTWELSLEETVVRAYKNRAELEQQLIQREIGQRDREIALAEIRPQVDFLAQYDARENLDDGVSVLTDWTFQARVSWRIFDGGRAFQGARSAERRMDQANTQFANQRNEIRFQVEEAYYSLVANEENIESTRRNVATFDEALRLARLRFQAGVGTQTDVIDAQRDLSDARGRFLQAIIQYNQSLNALQRAVSNLPDDGLFQKP
ncbi:MAG: TolC family protein [Cyanobacteria bacterium P01_G01_bin.49]